MTLGKWAIPAFVLAAVVLADCGTAAAQENAQVVRLSKLVIDPSQLEAYRSALREEVNASVRLEPGVLTLYAVAEKDRPTHFTQPKKSWVTSEAWTTLGKENHEN